MQNNNLLENLSKVFYQSTFMQSEELFKKIVDMAAKKLLTKQDHHEELTKKIISHKIHCRYAPIRKFKRINKKVISKKKLRESIIKKISISNKQIHVRYEEYKAKKCYKSSFYEYIHRIFGVPMYSDQEEEKQYYERECYKMNSRAETKRVTHETSKNADLKRPSYKDEVYKRFKKVHTNFQNYIKTKYKESKTDDMACPICIEILIEPVSTVCGHTFCYSCLDESLLFTHTCPVCRFHIKGMELVLCNHLSELINIKCEGKSMAPEYKETYHHRKRYNEKWREKRFIKVENTNLGSPIDVRDTENIWCPAIVLNLFYVDKTISSVLVHYLQWANLYNEVIEIKSGRLAPWGCFTKRTDVPRYNLHQESENLRGMVINGNQNYQHEIIRPEHNLSLMGRLRDLQSTVDTFRNIALGAQQNIANYNHSNIFILQNPFDAYNIPDYQSSESDSTSRYQEQINDEMAYYYYSQRELSPYESIQYEVPYGLLNSDEVTPDNSYVVPNYNSNNNYRNYHEESFNDDDEEEYENALYREESYQHSPSENYSGLIVIGRPGDRRNHYDDDDEESYPYRDYNNRNYQLRGRVVYRNGVHYLI